MNNSQKPRVILPKDPQTYYGSTLTVENLQKNLKLYIGEHNRVDEVIVEEIKFDDKLNSYEIYTDKAILLAGPLTRVAYSSNYKLQ